MLSIGTRVLAKWPAEQEWWYPGTIVGGGDGSVVVQYDDGDRTELQTDEVGPLMLGVGARVYVRWQTGPAYYPGRISEVLGSAIHVNYDDGDREWTTIGLVRVHQDER